MTLEIQVLTWNRHKNVVGLNWWMRLQTTPSDNWIPNDNNLIFILSFHPVKIGLLVMYNPPCLFEIQDGCHQHH